MTNQSVYSLRIDYSYWEQEKQNQTILALVRLIRDAGSEETDSLPITKQEPFEYMGEAAECRERKALAEFADKHELGSNLSAPEMLKALRKYYEVDESLSDGNARIIVGVRYEMDRIGFSTYNSFTIASDVSLDLISQVKERHSEFQGVNVDTTSVRKYETTSAGHILGRIGPMYVADWKGEDGQGGYNEKEGYQMNDLIGKQGVELAFEKYLHGVSGTRSIETDVSGKVTGVVEATKTRSRATTAF